MQHLLVVLVRAEALVVLVGHLLGRLLEELEMLVTLDFLEASRRPVV
jgi:hypothetical protein